VIGHLEEGVNAGHPRDEGFGILIRPTAVAGVHPGRVFVTPLDELKREG
jgi:hypothetical protein